MLFIDPYSAVLNKILFVNAQHFLKLRYRDTVVFRTKNEWMSRSWSFDSLQTINYTFPAVACWKSIVWSFSVLWWCNENLTGPSASIYFSSFLECLSLRVPSGVASPQIWGGQIFWL